MASKRQRFNELPDLKYDYVRMIRNHTKRINQKDETACLDSDANVQVLSVSALCS